MKRSAMPPKREKPRRTGKPLPRIKAPANFRSQELKDLAQHCECCQFCGAFAPGEIVGCHPNGLKYGKGMGLKAHDLVAYLCRECHDILDGRAGKLTDFEKDCMFHEAFYASMHWAFSGGWVGVVA